MLLALLTAGGITWALRALPFAVLEPMRDSEWLDYLGKRMPLGIMVILTVYTLDDVELTVAASAGPAFLALAVTVVLHVWRGNAVLSLFAAPESTRCSHASSRRDNRPARASRRHRHREEPCAARPHPLVRGIPRWEVPGTEHALTAGVELGPGNR